MCTSGYPLVHNATLCADLGYYYQGHDAKAGAARVLEAIDTHDAGLPAYRERQRAAIERFRPHDGAVVARYAALLDELMLRPPR